MRELFSRTRISIVALSCLTVSVSGLIAQPYGYSPKAIGKSGLGVDWNQIKKLAASDGVEGDAFGVSVAVSGSVVAVGAVSTDKDTGSVYIFTRNLGGHGTWEQMAKVTALDGDTVDQFGLSIDLDGDTLVVGSRNYDLDGGNNAGTVYVYERNLGGIDNWGEATKLVASDGWHNDRFGHAVAISNEYIVVGALTDDDGGDRSGSAYIFKNVDPETAQWVELRKITALDASTLASFGHSVAIDGDTVVVGAPSGNGGEPFSGSAYIFQKDTGGLDNWGQVVELSEGSKLGCAGSGGDEFGYSVDISADTVVVGAREDPGPSDVGYACIYERDHGGEWAEIQRLVASDAVANELFGYSVSIEEDMIAVGSYLSVHEGMRPGAVYLFERGQKQGDGWEEVLKLTASDASDLDTFGASVSLDSDLLVVGAQFGDGNFDDSGAAYLLQRHGISFSFPLPNRNPFNAAINTVFDHALVVPFCDDGDANVVAFTGEEGRAEFGVSDFSVDFGCGALRGFMNSEKKPFVVNGNYGSSDEDSLFLSYKAHPAHDFKTIDQAVGGQVDILAAQDGIVSFLGCLDPVGCFGTIELDHGNGFKTRYIHLSAHSVVLNQEVSAGQVIGVGGDIGAPGAPHLHFEVQREVDGKFVHVDPYGWMGTGTDPYSLAENVYLWEFPFEVFADGFESGDTSFWSDTVTQE